MNNSVSKTPISYYGGKTSLLSHILPLIPPHEVYTEAFFGGGSVFFAKEKVKNETINDRLDIVVNFYETIKTNFTQLNSLIQATLVSRTQHDRALAIYRRPAGCSNVEKAWAFWLLANFSFSNKLGGGIKYSNHQSTVVPEQMRNKKARFTEWLVTRIEDAHIENRDGRQVIKSRNVPKAFHYIDTPYHNADMGHYGGWTENDLIDTLDLCETLSGRFMLSNYNSEVLEAYIKKNGWFKKEISKRLQAPKIKNRDKKEVIVCNYSAACLKTKLF